MTGSVKTIIADKGFGFLRVANSPDVFFHSRDLEGLPFDQSLVEMAVEFDVRETDKGLRASKVRKAY